MKWRKLAALGMTAVIAATTVLTGCGSSSTDGESSGSDASTEFTFLTGGSVSSTFYDDYGDNPSVQYWLDREWDVDGESKTVTIDFTMPPEASPNDYVNTLLATGEYQDVICLSYVSETPAALYEEGILMDLTDYIENYMPNLKARIDANPSYYSQLTVEVDGERRYLFLPNCADDAEDAWGSYCYRRDWIVKYGTNPETGEPFTGGYDENGVWSDDVVFPCGETDPYYITDWEWMLDIFQTAIEEEGIEEGYAFQNTSDGYVGTGDLNSGFGGGLGYSGYYFDSDGVVQYGLTGENARAYLECMNYWYEQGWMNQDFEENTADTMWFSVDTAHTYTGQVGLWYGLTAQWGNGMATGEDDYTDGIYVAVAAQPINDKYGDASCQGVEPMQFYESSMMSLGYGITTAAEGKDIAALCTALDYLYSDEGALLRRYGFSDQQVAELEEEDSQLLDLYHEYGIDATYYVKEDEDGNTYYLKNQDVMQVTDLDVALNMVRLPGCSAFKNMQYGYDENKAHNMEQANMYEATGVLGLLTNQLSADQSSQKSLVDTNATTYISQAYGDFITGRVDIYDDAAWEEYVQTLKDYGYEEIVEDLNELAGN